MRAELIPLGGGEPITIRNTPVVLGRHHSCDVELSHSTVSSRHCELSSKNGYWYIRDLESRNGTRVNGKECESHKLEPGDVLSLAKHRFVVVYSLPTEEPMDSRLEDSFNAAASKSDIEVTESGNLAYLNTKASNMVEDSLGTLIPCGGGDPLPLYKIAILIGRHEDCDISLPSSTVSSQHCRLELKDGFWFAYDLGSRNGIRVDGRECESTWIQPGGILGIGKHRFQLMYHPPQRRDGGTIQDPALPEPPDES